MKTDIELIAEKIMLEFEGFTDGVRVMMLINRGIQNSNKGSKRWINKLVSFDKIGYHTNLLKLLHLQYYLADYDNRLYACVNPRKLHKAVKYFQHKQLDLNTEVETLSFYKNIQNNFCSALMKPHNRDGSLFLLDDDIVERSLSIIFHLNSVGIKVLHNYPTPKGSHIITQPFNPIEIEKIPELVIKKDALLLLHSLEN